MLVVTDIGNTHTVFGLYKGNEILGRWRVVSATHRTPDEYSAFVLSLLANEGIGHEHINRAIIGSVVPQLTPVWTQVWQQVVQVDALIVGPGIKTGLDIQYEDPREVGADRIVNSVAGLQKYGAPLIAVDFGTATTLDVVVAPNVYLGGMIAPGVKLALEALTGRAARLPSVELQPPESVIGRNPVQSILSGTFYGYVALVDGLIQRVWEDLGCKTAVISTGGLGKLMTAHSGFIEKFEPDLTLEGLKILYEMNSPKPAAI